MYVPPATKHMNKLLTILPDSVLVIEYGVFRKRTRQAHQ
jgi:hypothetical protein